MAGAFRTLFSNSFRGEPGSKSPRHRLPLTLVYKGAFDPFWSFRPEGLQVLEFGIWGLAPCGLWL